MESPVTSTSSPAPVIWVLADDRAGNRAQCLGVAERLGLGFKTVEIRYTALARLPNALRGRSLLGVDAASRKALTAPWPDVVIAAGRRTAPIARWIKRKSPKTRLLQLMWPDCAPGDFDCIVLPSHDKEHAELPQIMRVLGAPHRVTPQALKEAAEKWHAPLAHLPPAARIAVLTGGSTRYSTFTDGDYHRLGALAVTLATSVRGTLLVTTSRRTGASGEQILHGHIDRIPSYFHSWQSKGENPYLGFLGLADAVIVTADSIAMCSEACATRKPVFIYQPAALSPKHQRFANTLIASGYAYPLEEDFVQEMGKPLKHTPLDSAATIAEHIRSQWLPA